MGHPVLGVASEKQAGLTEIKVLKVVLVVMLVLVDSISSSSVIYDNICVVLISNVLMHCSVVDGSLQGSLVRLLKDLIVRVTV